MFTWSEKKKSIFLAFLILVDRELVIVIWPYRWVELGKKSVAKRVARLLNGERMGKGCPIKYFDGLC